jgi:CRP/FNR family transcriptional regulator, cyclic AMP receptor protein
VEHSSETAAFLAGVRLFERIEGADREAVARRLRARSMRKGQVLFRDGEPGEEMYVVRHGTMVISKPVTGNVEQVLARIGPGDFFGEMSLFDPAPRSATLQAESDVTLLVLDRQNLHHLIETSPQAAAAFFHALVNVFIERLRRSTDLVAEVTRWGLEATGLDVEAR